MSALPDVRSPSATRFLRSSPIPWCMSVILELTVWLGAEGADGRVGGQLVRVVDDAVGEDGAGAGEHVEAEVAALFGPFVVLFGEDGADEADDGVAVEEDADDVGAATTMLANTTRKCVTKSETRQTGPAPATPPPKRSAGSSTCEAPPPSAFATSPTTSPGRYSTPADSGPDYTLFCDEPLSDQEFGSGSAIEDMTSYSRSITDSVWCGRAAAGRRRSGARGRSKRVD